MQSLRGTASLRCSVTDRRIGRYSFFTRIFCDAPLRLSCGLTAAGVEGLTTRMNNVKQYMAAQVDHIKKRQVCSQNFSSLNQAAFLQASF